MGRRSFVCVLCRVWYIMQRYEQFHLISGATQAYVVTAGMDLWAGVDGALSLHRGVIWESFFDGLAKGNSGFGCSTVRSKSFI